MTLEFKLFGYCRHKRHNYQVWHVMRADSPHLVGLIHEFPDGRWQMHVLRSARHPGAPEVRTWHPTLDAAKDAHQTALRRRERRPIRRRSPVEIVDLKRYASGMRYPRQFPLSIAVVHTK